MKNIATIAVKGSFDILVVGDHFHGVEVQVRKHVMSHRQDDKGKIIHVGLVAHVIWKERVEAYKRSQNGQTTLVDGKEFKKQVQEAEGKARQVLEQFFISAETLIEGTVNDYLSAYPDLNKAPPIPAQPQTLIGAKPSQEASS